MLINAQHPEQVRVAIVENGKLQDYQLEMSSSGLFRGNIYLGVVAHIEPKLDAAFVNFGEARDGFLSRQDIVPSAMHADFQVQSGRPHVKECLRKGQKILVQVTHDPVGQKGGALDTDISVAGRYLVLRPFDENRRVSRKVEDGSTRSRVVERVSALDTPIGIGFIVRTNGLEQPKAALAQDLRALLRLWDRIEKAASTASAPILIYRDQDLIVQALRDLLDASIDEVLIDDDDQLKKVQTYMKAWMPRGTAKLTRYDGVIPLFTHFKVEDQIDLIYQPNINLPSGGSIVVERTEALTAVDVNSGRARGGVERTEIILKTNLEAADEVARQLRLRDIGGLIVVDFIDMRTSDHQRQVERAMKHALKNDRARVTIGRLSPNGLLEINRQRIQKALELRTHEVCGACDGLGYVPSPEVHTLSIIRRIEARAAASEISQAKITVHPDIANILLNQRRHELSAIEKRHEITIEVTGTYAVNRGCTDVHWEPRNTQSEKAAAVPQQTVAAAFDLKPENRRRSRGPGSRGPANKETEGKTSQEDKTAKQPKSNQQSSEPKQQKKQTQRRPRRGKKPAPASVEAVTDQSEPKQAKQQPERKPQPGKKADSTTQETNQRRQNTAPKQKDAEKQGSQAPEPTATSKPSAQEELELNGDPANTAPKKPRRRRRRRRPKKKDAGETEKQA